MLSAPSVLLAARMASRSEMKPSAPRCSTKSSTVVVSPSTTSRVVSTINGPVTLVTVTLICCVSLPPAPSLTCTVT